MVYLLVITRFPRHTLPSRNFGIRLEFSDSQPIPRTVIGGHRHFLAGSRLHCRGIDRNSARNYEELRSTKYKSGGKRAKVQWAFPKLQKSNFRGDVTVLSNWCLKIHFFLVMQGIMKSYGRFRVIFPSCWVECHLNCPITLRATKFDYGRNANPNFELS